MQLKTKGIVLSETSYSETSKILNVLTIDFGLIGIISKGCKSLKNKLRGVSNKMNYGEYTINYKEKGLSTLIEGTTLNSFKNIYVDMKKAMYAFYLIDLVSQVLKENNNKEIFHLLVPALIKINDGLSPELISNIVEIHLLDYLGVSLTLEECSLCGNKEDLITIDITSGGVICKNCYTEGYIMNNKALHLMQLLKKIDIEKLETLEITDDEIFKEIDKFIYEYYTSYTGVYIKKKDNMIKT
jgi:DNA repair protein RecO (recombination protein O)